MGKLQQERMKVKQRSPSGFEFYLNHEGPKWYSYALTHKYIVTTTFCHFSILNGKINMSYNNDIYMHILKL